MHPNPIFHQTDQSHSLAFARHRGFGVLAVSCPGAAPHLSHVPFLLGAAGDHALLHLVRSNPIARMGRDAVLPARLDVLGPDGYVSPDWYGLDDQVPTWNYVAVHLVGTLHPLPVADLPGVLAAQSAAYEGQLPKTPWTMEKMTDETRARFMRMILPFRLEITTVDATWKLGQNKPAAAREAAAGAVAGGLGNDLGTLADLMRHPPDLDP